MQYVIEPEQQLYPAERCIKVRFEISTANVLMNTISYVVIFWHTSYPKKVCKIWRGGGGSPEGRKYVKITI